MTLPVPFGPSLRVQIFESDLAALEYRPTHGGSGRCYLGYEPDQLYDGVGSAPTDTVAEAAALSRWAAAVTGAQVEPDILRWFIAGPGGGNQPETFVEDTVVTFTRWLGLPDPPAISG